MPDEEVLTLKNLVAAGEADLKAEVAEDKAKADAVAADLKEKWNNLRQEASKVFGPLADLIPATPPDDFEVGARTGDYLVTIKPFGGVTSLSAGFYRARDVYNSYQWLKRDNRVSAYCKPRIDTNKDEYVVTCDMEGRAVSLAVGCALCARGEKESEKLLIEAKKRNKEKAAQPEKKPPTRGEELLEALRRFVDTRDA
jgi:hypothetical protein